VSREQTRRPGRQAPVTEAKARDQDERRRRSLKVSTLCLHAMAWVLLTFYATDYLPALAIRFSVGLRVSRLDQYVVGYIVLSLICLALAMGFGVLYQPRISASRYSWRWLVFPVAVALWLIPAQGANELLTRAVEALCLAGGIALGEGVSRPLRRRWRRPAPGRVAAG